VLQFMRAGLTSGLRQSIVALMIAGVAVWTLRAHSLRASWTTDVPSCAECHIGLLLGLADLLAAAAVIATNQHALHVTAMDLARAAARLNKWDAHEALTRLLVMLVFAAAACAVAIISGPPTWIAAVGDLLDQSLLAAVIWPSVLSVAFAFFAAIARSASIALGA
jgi:hypothetical protein